MYLLIQSIRRLGLSVSSFLSLDFGYYMFIFLRQMLRLFNLFRILISPLIISFLLETSNVTLLVAVFYLPSLMRNWLFPLTKGKTFILSDLLEGLVYFWLRDTFLLSLFPVLCSVSSIFISKLFTPKALHLIFNN